MCIHIKLHLIAPRDKVLSHAPLDDSVFGYISHQNCSLQAMKFAHIRQDSTQYVPCNVPDDQISASVGDASEPHSSHEVTDAVNHAVDTKWSRYLVFYWWCSI